MCVRPRCRTENPESSLAARPSGTAERGGETTDIDGFGGTTLCPVASLPA